MALRGLDMACLTRDGTAGPWSTGDASYTCPPYLVAKKLLCPHFLVPGKTQLGRQLCERLIEGFRPFIPREGFNRKLCSPPSQSIPKSFV